MDKINKNVVVVFLLIVLAVWVIHPWLNMRREKFDSNGQEFVPVGSDRYGLRGDLLRRSDIKRLFIKENPEILISDSGADMWISNNTPEIQGMKNCKKVQCPAYGYDNLDQCWQCAHEPIKYQAPELWPHVKI